MFPLISAIRDNSITLSHCSWFGTEADSGFRYIRYFSFRNQNALSEDLDRTFLKEESEHFLLLRVTFQLQQMTSRKEKKIWWSWSLLQKLHTFVDFQQNLHKTFRKLVESILCSVRNYLVQPWRCEVWLALKKVNIFCSIWDHLVQFSGPWPEHFEGRHAGLLAPKICPKYFVSQKKKYVIMFEMYFWASDAF